MTGNSVLGVARKVRNTKRRLTATPLKGNADCDSCGKTPAFEVGVGRITAQPPHIPSSNSRSASPADGALPLNSSKRSGHVAEDRRGQSWIDTGHLDVFCWLGLGRVRGRTSIRRIHSCAGCYRFSRSALLRSVPRRLPMQRSSASPARSRFR